MDANKSKTYKALSDEVNALARSINTAGVSRDAVMGAKKRRKAAKKSSAKKSSSKKTSKRKSSTKKVSKRKSSKKSKMAMFGDKLITLGIKLDGKNARRTARR